ncbi:MAG: CPBP family intramembrane glutamic endopeptidase [Hyphomicrobiaceae bacterium]
MTLAEDTAVRVPEPPRNGYVAMSPYGLLGAIGWTLLALLAGVIAFGIGTALALVLQHGQLVGQGLDGLRSLPSIEQMALSLYGMLAMQIVVVLMAVLAASRRGYRSSDVLALRAPKSGWVYLWGPLLVIVVAIAVGNLLYYVMPDDSMQDMQLWLPLVNSDHWWLVFVVAALGAPLSEEVWFRGFLLPSFTRTFSGNRPGKGNDPVLVRAALPIVFAAIATAVLFAAAHAYSSQGAITVLALGLTLSFVVWRSGSLWAAMVSHGVYNLAVFSYVKWGMPYVEAAASGQAT